MIVYWKYTKKGNYVENRIKQGYETNIENNS